MTSKRNPQQQLAIDSDEPAIVLSSGAGCGKTAVLVERYLRLIAKPYKVSEIVAITFTERAAREMRGRIRNVVEAKAADKKPGVWKQRQDDLETARIDTIHGFCGWVLRKFAAEAGLDPQFAVLSGPLAASVRGEAIRHELYRLLLDDSEAGTDLQELVVLYGWPVVRSAIEQLVEDADAPAWRAWMARDPEAIAAEWLNVRGALWPEWVKYLEAAEPWVIGFANLLERVKPTAGKARDLMQTVRAHWNDLRTATNCDRVTCLAGVLKQCATVKGAPKKVWPDDATYDAVKEAFENVREKIEKCVEPFQRDPDGLGATVVVARRFLNVAIHAEAAFRTAKRARNGLDFQDLLVLTRDLLQSDAICEKLREQFRVVLLDELQDTDPIQMELVDRLVGRNPRQLKLFAVGDEKQSIYRFRGADVALFNKLKQDVPDAGRLSLTTNYRSRPEILRFVNTLFSRRMESYESLAPGKAACGFAAGAKPQAAVEFLWSVPAAESRKETAEQIRTREAENIARRLKDLFTQGVAPKDVTMLFRALSNVAIYEEALRRHDIDYYLVGGSAFFAQQEIYDLHNLLQAIENPFNGPALAGALRSPFFNLSDDGLLILGMHEDGLWSGLKDDDRFAKLPECDQPVVRRVREYFAKWRHQKDRLPIARLIGLIFADTGFDAATQFEPLADRKLANLWKLVDLAREFDQGGFGLAAFAEQLGDQVARQPREEQAATTPAEANVVRIMTIHQAKGLEFPVVVIADVGAESRPSFFPAARWDRRFGCVPRKPSDLPDDEEPPFSYAPDQLARKFDEIADWQEHLRIFYVACTRAEEMLILSAGLPEQPTAGVPAKANYAMLLLAERFDLRTGECRADDASEPEAVRVVVSQSGGTGVPPVHAPKTGVPPVPPD